MLALKKVSYQEIYLFNETELVVLFLKFESIKTNRFEFNEKISIKTNKFDRLSILINASPLNI